MRRLTLNTQGCLVQTSHGEYVEWRDVRPLLREAAALVGEMNRLMPRKDASRFLEMLKTDHRIDEV